MVPESQPLVTVILTAYNHEKFVLGSLESVRTQDYSNLELIIVDNASRDRSREVIKTWIDSHGGSLVRKLIFRSESIPYCKSFNDAFSYSQGKYFVDLSGDDELLPDHISKSVARLNESLGAACCFSDILQLYKSGKKRTFFKRDRSGHLAQKIKIGNVYTRVVQRYYIPSVSLVFDSEIFLKEGGYDESLSYEDFDIIVRLARNYLFVFSNHIGVVKNIHPGSFAASQYASKNSQMLPSTLKVCQKIREMNRRPKEDKALLRRIYHESKHALLSGNFEVARGFLTLAKQVGAKGLEFQILQTWSASRLDLSQMYTLLK